MIDKFSLTTILNSNVFLTNLLLIPLIVLSFYICIDIFSWKIQPKNTTVNIFRNVYKCIWVFFFIQFCLTLVFSNIYHWNMFTHNIFWKLIGLVDETITAPLTFVILILLYINYIIFLNYNDIKLDTNTDNLKKISVPIYVLSVFFALIGTFSWIIKRFYFNTEYINFNTRVTSTKQKALWTTGHIFFHYTSYTAALLLILLYYIENKNIYKQLHSMYMNIKDI